MLKVVKGKRPTIADAQRTKIIVDMYTIDKAHAKHIAKTLKVSTATVYRILRFKKVTLRAGSSRLGEIAKSAVLQARHRRVLENHKNWHVLEKARALVERGCTYSEAASQTGVTRNMIAGHMYRYNNRKLHGLKY